MKSASQKRKVNETQSARGRLKGAHEEIVAETDDEEDDSDNEALASVAKKKPYLQTRGRPPKYLKETASPHASPKSSKSSINQQKISTLQQETQSTSQDSDANMQVQESFVMKLFDRSLDLSKYDDRTGLYPICRAWISNTPRAQNIPSYRNKESPPRENRINNGIEVLAKLRRGEIKTLASMPACEESDIPKIMSIDSPRINGKSTEVIQNIDEFVFNNAQDISHEDLITDHKMKWKNVRKKWEKHRKQYQLRKEINLLIIQELAKPL